MTWIKCSDQPPPDGWHLAYSPIYGIMLSRQRVHVTDAFGRQMECTESGIETTHWRPMPEPPGAEQPRKVKLPQRQIPQSKLDYSPRMVGWNDCLNEVETALKAAGVEVE